MRNTVGEESEKVRKHIIQHTRSNPKMDWGVNLLFIAHKIQKILEDHFNI